MVFMPPGSAKSTYASVRFPAYYLGKHPRKNIICASYGDTLATSFGRKVRNILPTKEYQNLFPDISLSQDSQSKGEWETNQGGSYFAVGVGSGVTGRRADLGVIDDPVKSRKEADSELVKENTWQWYKSDFLTRLKPNASQVIIQTRWIEDDLSGRILPEEWSGESGVFLGRDNKEWHVICLQAEAEEGKNDPLGRKPGEWLWPEWFTPEYWKETKDTQLSDIRNWNSLFQQRPSVEEGIYFKKEWFQWYEEPPVHLNTYGASDYAVTEDGGDWTEHGVGGVDPLDNLYLIDWWRGQTTADEWIETQLDLIREHQPLLWVGESGPIRRSIEPFLNKRMEERRDYCNLDWFPSITDKASRARAFQARAAAKKVFLPNKPWAHELLRQLLRFPAGAVDDGVDVCSLFGRMLDQTYAAKLPSNAHRRRETDAWGRPQRDSGSWKTA